MLLGCAGSALGVSHYPKTRFGPEGMLVERGVPLAPAAARHGEPVDGVSCDPPQKAFHIHVHLAVYVLGALRPVPAAIGLVAPYRKATPTGPFYDAHTCYYSLHTHAQDGVIHVEAAARRRFTLGQAFAVWGVPLSSGRVGSAVGPLRVYVDGRPSILPPGRIPLRNRSDIQIDVGTDVPPQPVDWSHF